MNIITLRSQARKKSGVNATDYSDSTLLEDFNVSYYTLASVIAQLQADYYEEQNVKFPLLQNSALYSLPCDFMAMKQVRLSYSTPTGPSSYRVARSYDPSSVHDVGADEENISTNSPMYNITGDYFRVKPTPTAAVSEGGKLWYIARPSALTNTGDTPILPLQYHDMIAVYGAIQMTFKFQKWAKHDRLKKEWDAFINPLMERLQDLADRDMGQALTFKSPTEAPRGPTRELVDN